MMDVRTHRANQIGGCITEISTATTKIVLDFGEELEYSRAELNVSEILNGCAAVFLSHYHGDHIGMCGKIPNELPIYMGGLSKRMSGILAVHTEHHTNGNVPMIENFRTYRVRVPIHIGNIKITPFFVDHSALDAHMFLVESDGEKILYTGDFRGHGFRGNKLKPMLQKYVGAVDSLIIEGTTLSRENFHAEPEHDLQVRAKKQFESKKYIFVLCSSMNIDRIGSFCKATPGGKYFLCDEYQKSMLNVVSNELGKIPLYNFSRARVYLNGDLFEQKRKERGFVMLVRPTDYFRKIIDQYPPEERLVIYSMWEGYKKNIEKYPHAKFLDGLEYEYLHTSGHADETAIKSVVETVKPKKIYPIHTENPEWFVKNFPDMEIVIQK